MVFVGCGLDEDPDFLIGRSCDPRGMDCDPGQQCLPHTKSDSGSLGTFLCRDEASLESGPRAFCDAGIPCPGGWECRPERIREGPRDLVCVAPDDPFGPPTGS
jgi:hypothetical protein